MYDVDAAGWFLEVREQMKVIAKTELLQVTVESAGSLLLVWALSYCSLLPLPLLVLLPNNRIATNMDDENFTSGKHACAHSLHFLQ